VKINNPAEDDAVEGRTSLRASTKASTRKSLESSYEGSSTQETGERGRPPMRQRMTRSSVKKQPEESTRRRSLSAKRRRSDAMDTDEPPTKVAKRSSRGRASKVKGKPQAGTVHKNLCNDILLHTDHGLVRTPFDDSKYTPGLSPHDLDTRDDVQEVSDYVTDIFQRLYDAEVSIGEPFSATFPARIIFLTSSSNLLLCYRRGQLLFRTWTTKNSSTA
jgi:hypothetical protein